MVVYLYNQTKKEQCHSFMERSGHTHDNLTFQHLSQLVIMLNTIVITTTKAVCPL